MIKVDAMEASSIQTSDLFLSAVMTIPNGALDKNAEPCFLDKDNRDNIFLSSTTINCQGYLECEDGESKAA